MGIVDGGLLSLAVGRSSGCCISWTTSGGNSRANGSHGAGFNRDVRGSFMVLDLTDTAFHGLYTAV